MEKVVKEYILDEIRTEVSGINIDKMEELVELFSAVLDYPVTVAEVDGVGIRINRAMSALVKDKHDKDSLSNLIDAINKIEAYARKVLYIVNPKKYLELVNSNSNNGFSAVLQHININVSKFQLKRMKEIRNIESHNCCNWNKHQIEYLMVEYMVAYIQITNSQANVLKKIIYKSHADSEENSLIDLSQYADAIIKKFAERFKRTVQLESEENIKNLNLYAEEKVKDGLARRGTVMHLMNILSEKRMMLWGDAGAGKTTTLEYLAYSDAKKIKENNEKIPVLIYLGSTTNEHYTLLDYIQQKLDVDNQVLLQWLKCGKINLYLDGFNEIPLTERNMLKSKRRREITELLMNYPDTFIVLSNRPQDGGEFENIPIFNLLKMSDDQIREFLDKNAKDEVKEIVKGAIESDDNLKQLVKKPLILTSLIFVVTTTGEIPKREGQIIGKFLEALFVRERKEKFDEYLDEKKINYFLRRIGFETKEQNKANSGISEEMLLDIMNKCQKDYNFTYDSMYVIEVVTALGILEKREGTYVFAHQSYQDYYHSQEMAAILGM